MKFTNGYWLMRENIKPLFAVEYGMHSLTGDGALEIIAYTRQVNGRSGHIGLPVLTVRLDTPMDDVLHVTVTHNKGEAVRGPRFELNSNPGARGVVTDSEDSLRFTTGKLSAELSKKGWELSFSGGGKHLCSSGYRSMARMLDTDTGLSYMTEQLSLSVGECLYGLGERFTPFVKNGQSVDIWNEDGGTASEQAYKNIPFYVSGRGYGVFVDNPGAVSFELGSEKVQRAAFSVQGESISYYIINGPSLKEVLSRYTALTGRPALPPDWSFGLWLSTSFTTDYDEATVMSFIDGMDQRGIPLSVFHFDCFWMRGLRWCDFEWDPEVFPDPRGMLSRLKARGLKICVWINPYISQLSPLFSECAEQGFLIKTEDGGVWQSDLWQPGMGVVDFSNPGAVKWYQDKLEALLDMGVDCFKTDFGERIPSAGVKYHDGSDPVKMHNYYAYLYNRAVFELLERKRGRGEAVVFARSATAGGQQFPVHWGGDCEASFASMAESLRGGLSLSLCGFGFWSHDIGGFEHTASADVYKRWCAFGCLSSHSRLHGSTSYRVPWLYDEEASAVLKYFVGVKQHLTPYLLKQAAAAHETGVPLMRPMVMEFQDDPACKYLDTQYMLGESLLVAPVFSGDGTTEYYLPQGRWKHLLTGEDRDGGKFFRETHDFFSLPVWIREGAELEPCVTGESRYKI